MPRPKSAAKSPSLQKKHVVSGGKRNYDYSPSLSYSSPSSPGSFTIANSPPKRSMKRQSIKKPPSLQKKHVASGGKRNYYSLYSSPSSSESFTIANSPPKRSIKRQSIKKSGGKRNYYYSPSSLYSPPSSSGSFRIANSPKRSIKRQSQVKKEKAKKREQEEEEKEDNVFNEIPLPNEHPLFFPFNKRLQCKNPRGDFRGDAHCLNVFSKRMYQYKNGTYPTEQKEDIEIRNRYETQTVNNICGQNEHMSRMCLETILQQMKTKWPGMNINKMLEHIIDEPKSKSKSNVLPEALPNIAGVMLNDDGDVYALIDGHQNVTRLIKPIPVNNKKSNKKTPNKNKSNEETFSITMPIFHDEPTSSNTATKKITTPKKKIPLAPPRNVEIPVAPPIGPAKIPVVITDSRENAVKLENTIAKAPLAKPSIQAALMDQIKNAPRQNLKKQPVKHGKTPEKQSSQNAVLFRNNNFNAVPIALKAAVQARRPAIENDDDDDEWEN